MEKRNAERDRGRELCTKQMRGSKYKALQKQKIGIWIVASCDINFATVKSKEAYKIDTNKIMIPIKHAIHLLSNQHSN